MNEKLTKSQTPFSFFVFDTIGQEAVASSYALSGIPLDNDLYKLVPALICLGESCGLFFVYPAQTRFLHHELDSMT